ncbi:MAG: CBS domain-containing protein [Myxococcota bacterium]
MNLAFLLTPVADVVWLPVAATVREAIDSLRAWRYTAVPILDSEGRYSGTVTAADLLFHLVEVGQQGTLANLQRRREHVAVSIDTDVRAVLAVAADQNFVPVIDSRGVLMGIVTRRAILQHVERRWTEDVLLPEGASKR